MKTVRLREVWAPILLFGVAFMALPISQFENFTLLPGDIGDPRLNNYFLENIYQFLAGHSKSLWHLSFFYPFPYVLGFSDNLFGAAPIYVLARLFTGQSDTAFQVWFLAGYVFNFCAAYYALRRLKVSSLAATVGALIFAFALPTTAHASQAQLHYRFGLALAIVFFIEFLDEKRLHAFLVAGFWLVWQFYAGVYMGFFTLLLLAVISAIYIGHGVITREASLVDFAKPFTTQWALQSGQQRAVILFGLGILFLLMILLFYPYLQVSHLYGPIRPWSEIASMLPRPQSYFLADASYIWSARDSKLFDGIPMRHEHQMFVGLLPTLLALLGFWVGHSQKKGLVFALMAGLLLTIIGLTLYVGGVSLWYVFHHLPLASAIRAMTRIDQALLLPIAYLSALSIDFLRNRFDWGSKAIWMVVLPLLIFEFSATAMSKSSKESWRQRIETAESMLPRELPRDSVIFMAQRGGSLAADELDAMWVSLHRGLETLNGYSGFSPPRYSLHYGNDCAELPRRVLSYLEFTGNGNIAAYRDLMARIVPIGLEGCNPIWLDRPPQISSAVIE